MRVSFLVDDLSCCSNLQLPDEATGRMDVLSSNSKFSVFTCEMKGESLETANTLADIRDQIIGEHARLLDDDPSGKYEKYLYGLLG